MSCSLVLQLKEKLVSMVHVGPSNRNVLTEFIAFAVLCVEALYALVLLGTVMAQPNWSSVLVVCG